MQTELLNRKRWKTRIELANAIFGYLEIFHNRQRRHSALGIRTRYNSKCFTKPPNPWPETQQHDSRKPGAHQSLRTCRGDSKLRCLAACFLRV